MARKRSFLEEARGRRIQPEKKGSWSEEKYTPTYRGIRDSYVGASDGVTLCPKLRSSFHSSLSYVHCSSRALFYNGLGIRYGTTILMQHFVFHSLEASFLNHSAMPVPATESCPAAAYTP